MSPCVISQLIGLSSGIPLKILHFFDKNKYHKTKECLRNEAVWTVLTFRKFLSIYRRWLLTIKVIHFIGLVLVLECFRRELSCWINVLNIFIVICSCSIIVSRKPRLQYFQFSTLDWFCITNCSKHCYGFTWNCLLIGVCCGVWSCRVWQWCRSTELILYFLNWL